METNLSWWERVLLWGFYLLMVAFTVGIYGAVIFSEYGGAWQRFWIVWSLITGPLTVAMMIALIIQDIRVNRDASV